MSEEGRALGAALARFMSGERPPKPETDRRELARAVQRAMNSHDLNASGSPLPRIPREHPRDLARAVENYRKKAAGLLQDVSHVQGNGDTTAAREDFRGADDWMLPPLASSGADAQPAAARRERGRRAAPGAARDDERQGDARARARMVMDATASRLPGKVGIRVRADPVRRGADRPRLWRDARRFPPRRRTRAGKPRRRSRRGGVQSG